MIKFKTPLALKDYDSVSLAEILRQYFREQFPVAFTERLGDAIHVASYLHRKDVRRGARGKSLTPPYIEHPLRVAIRMAETFEVRNPDTLIAAVLHDTVEDHAHDFADFWGVYRVNKNDHEGARKYARYYLEEFFGFETAYLIELVSNPILPPDTPKAEKILAYQKHVAYTVKVDPRALVLKVSDFVDNAGSLHHHYAYDDKKVTYFLDRYEPLVQVYRTELKSTSAVGFNAEATLKRLEQVAEQFKKFREGTA